MISFKILLLYLHLLLTNNYTHKLLQADFLHDIYILAILGKYRTHCNMVNIKTKSSYNQNKTRKGNFTNDNRRVWKYSS